MEQPLWLWIGLALALLVGVTIHLWRQRRRAAVEALGSWGVLERLTRADLPGSPLRRGVLLVGATTCLALALAGPQWGAQEVEERTSALSLVIAVDVSESMWAEDVEPNRLERARLEARRLVNELTGNRVGVVAFAGFAYPLSPLTIDYGALHLFLDALDPTMAGTPGSSPGDALREALKLMQQGEDDADRAIILISDGESHQPREEVLSAASEAAEAAVRLFVIGVGEERGEPIPRHDRTGVKMGGYKQNARGSVVLTKLEREPLATAARETGGFWARADEGAASRVLAALSDLQRGHGQLTREVRWTPRFQWFIAAAILLLIVDWGWAWRGRG